MLHIEPKQFTLFSAMVYDRIPENHLLKRLEQAIDFSIINDLLADSYCLDFTRPAKEPELLMRILFLKHIYNLSDDTVGLVQTPKGRQKGDTTIFLEKGIL